jgi:hypothetical protein
VRVAIVNGDAQVIIETDMIVHDSEALQTMAAEAVRIYLEAFPDEDAQATQS